MSSLSRSKPRLRGEFGVFLSPPCGGWCGLGGFNGLEWSKSFRAHGPMLPDLLDDYWERAALSCNRFENISAVDKYCVTCTLCSYFEEECCSPEFVGPSIVKLLKASYKHDGLTWQ